MRRPIVLTFIVLVALVACTTASFAQEECDTELKHERLMAEDDAYRRASESFPSAQAAPDTGQTFVIPLVFHIIHLGEEVGTGSNISAGRVNDAIARMNENFTNVLGTDIGIQFCLATTGPDGLATSGIVRVDGRSVPDFETLGLESSAGPGADETAVKGLSRWPNNAYYNVWVVHRIAGSVAGNAQYPSSGINDGTAAEAAYINATSSLLTHELGHGFNLRHTFNGDNDGASCPPNALCLLQGDYICDTPPHKRSECSVSSCSPNAPMLQNSTENFMSYCSNKIRFTDEQRLRLRLTANTHPRVLLTRSDVCRPLPARDGNLLSIDAPSAGIINDYCNSTFSGLFTLANSGTETINSFGISYSYDGVMESADYTADLATGETGQFSLPVAELDTDLDVHTLEIIVVSINESDDQNPLNDTASIDFQISDSCVTTGVFDNFFSKVTVYPNPLRDHRIYFTGLDSRSGKITLSITDPLGRQVSEVQLDLSNASANLSGLASGAYFATLCSEGRIRTFRILKQ